MSGTVIERGVLPNGDPYYVWKRSDGWTRAFVGKKATRRSMRWLREQFK